MEKLYFSKDTFVTKEQLYKHMSGWTDDDLKDLELKTRGQSSNPLWIKARVGRITASKCSRIVKAYKQAQPQKEALDKLASEIISATSPSFNMFAKRAIQWGLDNECRAMCKFKELYPELIIEEHHGLFVSSKHMFLGASPDGLALDGQEKLLIEIKCPYTVKNTTSIDSALDCGMLKYITKMDEDTYSLNLSNAQGHNYHHQIQMSLYILGLNICKLVIYTPQWIQVINIPKDSDWEKDNVEDLVKFWNEHVITQITKSQ